MPLYAVSNTLVPVSWTAADGVQLKGLYHGPQSGHWVWICLHGLASTKEEWLPLAQKMVGEGDGVLLYDARGHGESVHRADGGTIKYQQFTSIGPGSEWDHMMDDLDSAVQYVQRKRHIDKSRIAIAGASLGANVSLVYASHHPEVPAVILLSPGMSYAGIQTPDAFVHYGTRPLFMAASPADGYAYASVQQLASLRTDSHMMLAQGEGAAHGVNMLNDSFTKRLLDWIRKLQ